MCTKNVIYTSIFTVFIQIEMFKTFSLVYSVFSSGKAIIFLIYSFYLQKSIHFFLYILCFISPLVVHYWTWTKLHFRDFLQFSALISHHVFIHSIDSGTFFFIFFLFSLKSFSFFFTVKAKDFPEFVLMIVEIVDFDTHQSLLSFINIII